MHGKPEHNRIMNEGCKCDMGQYVHAFTLKYKFAFVFRLQY